MFWRARACGTTHGTVCWPCPWACVLLEYFKQNWARHTGVCTRAHGRVAAIFFSPCFNEHGRVELGEKAHGRVSLGHTGVCLGFQTHTGSMHGRVPCRKEDARACLRDARSCARPRNCRWRLEIQKFPHQHFHTPNHQTYTNFTATNMPINIISSSQHAK